jgi:hypothetical protein
MINSASQCTNGVKALIHIGSAPESRIFPEKKTQSIRNPVTHHTAPPHPIGIGSNRDWDLPVHAYWSLGGI